MRLPSIPHLLVRPVGIARCGATLLALLLVCASQLSGQIADPNWRNPYTTQTFWEGGKQIDEIVVPGRPPGFKMPVALIPMANATESVSILTNVPAFTWCYGCSATSAGMMMGYYDNNGYPNMYAGPSNGGVCPLNNETYWGHTDWPQVTCGECPLVATHNGYDGRRTRGHVDDYWIDYLDPGPDPYYVNGWAEHTQGECTADYMATNQSKYGDADGETRFFYHVDGSPMIDYTGREPAQRDGCHGVKLFAVSRGYTVTTNFSQYIYGYKGNKLGFTFANLKTEIDAGRPVLIQVEGHTMLGYGYNDTGSIIYIHDTWDNSDHSMSWGGSYSGMKHYGVTVLRLVPVCAAPGIAAHPSNVTLCSGAAATFAVTASGTSPLSYQWRKGTINITNAGHYSGATTATLTVSPAAPEDAAANYNCKVTNACGNATSNNASLTVSTAPVIAAAPWPNHKS